MTLDISAIRQRCSKGRFKEFEHETVLALCDEVQRLTEDNADLRRQLWTGVVKVLHCRADSDEPIHGGSAPSVPTEQSPKEEGK